MDEANLLACRHATKRHCVRRDYRELMVKAGTLTLVTKGADASPSEPA